MFGNPPLMAVSIAGLAGPCSVPSAAIAVAPDATVTGTVANVPIQRARIEPNRSWFGRLLGWRTDYRIRGVLTTGEQLNILLNAKPTGLTGTVESPRRYANPDPAPPGPPAKPARPARPARPIPAQSSQPRPGTL